MSQVKDNFLAAARARNWRDAYLNCNGLNMFEMLRGLEEIGPSLMFEMRPGGGALIDHAHDVFLPVTDHAQVDRSPTGTFAGDMGRVLQPARDALQQAANNNGRAQISFMFPDGVDHLHIKALPRVRLCVGHPRGSAANYWTRLRSWARSSGEKWL